MVMASPNAHDEVRKMREKVHNHELRIRGSVCQLEYLADMRFLFLKGEVSSCQHSIRYEWRRITAFLLSQLSKRGFENDSKNDC